jgi:hypothetical protein
MLHRSLLNSKFEWEAHTLIRSGAIEVMTASHDYPMVTIAMVSVFVFFGNTIFGGLPCGQKFGKNFWYSLIKFGMNYGNSVCD